MKLRYKFYVLGLVACLLPAVGAPLKPSLVDKFHKEASSIWLLEAEFVQTNINKAFGSRRSRRGSFHFLQPDSIQWEYKEEPFRRYVAEGKTLWVAEMDSKKKIRRVLKNDQFNFSESQISLLVHPDPKRMKKEFDVVKINEKEKSFVLKPKNPVEGVSELTLFVDPQNLGVPQKIVFLDELKNQTEIVFGKTKFLLKNQFNKLSVLEKNKIKNNFSFTPPKGVEIVESHSEIK